MNAGTKGSMEGGKKGVQESIGGQQRSSVGERKQQTRPSIGEYKPGTRPSPEPEKPEPLSAVIASLAPVRFVWRLTPKSWDAWWHVVKVFALFAATALVLTHRVASPRPVRGPSMLPTFNVDGDVLLTSYLYPSVLPIRAGDMVAFESPTRAGERAIKRVLGLPGDLVLRDTPPGSTDNFWIEGDRARWLADQSRDRGPGWMVRVPEGHVWVVGDNLPWSRDSRHFGPLPLALVKGRVLARVAPWSQRQWYRRSDVFTDID